MKDESNVDKLVRMDDGYRIFRTLKGSPPYLECAQQMICLQWPGTFVLSMSAAEPHWKQLLKSLVQIIDGTQISDTDIDNMTWQTKCRLILSDPVTIPKYFD